MAKKPTGKQPPLDPSLIPVAPAPAATLIGPQVSKPPARAKPPPIPAKALVAGSRAKVPRPGKQASPPPDPAKLRAKKMKPLRALGKEARWRFEGDAVVELRLNGYDAGCTPSNISAVLNSEPVTDLAIEGCDPDQLARLLALPGIERIKRLAVSGWDATEGGAYVGRVIAKAKRVSGVVELRAGIKLGDAGLASLAGADALGACVHLALGMPDASTEAFAALAASPLGQQLETLEWVREPITEELAQVIVSMPCLQTFSASVACTNAFERVFGARFRDRFIIENEPGLGYLLDGVKGISYRAPPRR
jgi:hypothetical protein